MKKITLLILFSTGLHALIAQPVINNSYNFNIGDYYRVDMYIDTENIEPGPGGANLTWDFGMINGTYIEGQAVVGVDPSTTPFADSSAVATSDVCIRCAEFPDHGPYSYYNCYNDKEEQVAIGYKDPGNNSYSNFSDPQTVFDYPFTYGDIITDNYELMSYHIDMGYYFMRDSVQVVSEADAYGTIITPLGEFSNVLRQKKTTIEYFWYRYDPGEPWSFNGIFTNIEYQWFAPGIKVPVFAIAEDIESRDDFMVSYLAEYDFVSEITSFDDKDFSIYPNPASELIYISGNLSNNTPTYCCIYELSGKKIWNKPFTYEPLNIETLKPGLYILELNSMNSKYRKKIIIE